MGKKGTKKRTKWQALPINEDSNKQESSTKNHHFSNGVASNKTAVWDTQKSSQLTTSFLNHRKPLKSFERNAPESSDHSGVVVNGDSESDKHQHSKVQMTDAQMDCSSSSKSANSNNGTYSSYKYRDSYHYNRHYPPHQPHHRSSRHHSNSTSSYHNQYNMGYKKHGSAEGSSESANSSTTSSSNYQYTNSYYDNGWRSRNSGYYYRSGGYGYNKENNSVTSGKVTINDEEYTRITTPRQDVLFKKGYLSRKREPPVPTQINEVGPTPAETVPVTDEVKQFPGEMPIVGDSAQMEAVDPNMVGDYYMYPGYVDHNGVFYVNSYMPNSFDPYGQPLVMMPYAPTTPDPASVAFPSNEQPCLDVVANEPINGEESVSEEKSEMQNLDETTNKDDSGIVVINEGYLNDTSEETVPLSSDVNPEPNCIENMNGVDAAQVPVEEPQYPGFVPNVDDPNDAALVNNKPLDPTSTSYYPQSPVPTLYPYYPVILTPQALPPNTSIIPLADLYYDEQYASLANEFFGLAPADPSSLVLPTTNSTCDESVVDSQPQPDCVTNGEPHQTDSNINQIGEENDGTSIANVDKNAEELAKRSNLNVDVEEFHPKNSTNAANCDVGVIGKENVKEEGNALRSRSKDHINGNNNKDKKRSSQSQQSSNPTKLPAHQKTHNPQKLTKKSIIESTKHIEDQNIDLKRNSVLAAVSSSEIAQNNNNSNKWQCLVKGKGKKAMVVIPDEVQEPETEEVDLNDSLNTVLSVSDKVPESPNHQTTCKSKKKLPKSNKKNKGKKTNKGSGKNHQNNGGFEVIEPDFGEINLNKRKTETVVEVSDKESEIEEDEVQIESAIEEEQITVKAITNETHVPFSPSPIGDRIDNVIDLIDDDDCQQLEESLLNFSLTGNEDLILEALRCDVPNLSNGHIDYKTSKEKNDELEAELISEPLFISQNQSVMDAKELKINTNLREEEEEEELQSAESSSAPSSMSSPIPTDDGRDGSNSESDDAAIPEVIKPIPKPQPEKVVVVSGICDAVSKWLNEKQTEENIDSILRIPDDPQLAKKIYGAIFGVEFVSNLEFEDNESDEEDDDDLTSLSDSSDLESDLRPTKATKNAKSNPSRVQLANGSVPIDTDSDYMSDGQNMRAGERVADVVEVGNGQLKGVNYSVQSDKKERKAHQNCKVM